MCLGPLGLPPNSPDIDQIADAGIWHGRVSTGVMTGSPHQLGWNRDGSEVGEILTTVHQEFSGCAHCCMGKPKCREQD